MVLRAAFGGTLLLGLEVLVAADLVRTVAVAPTLDNVLVLGLIVLIRTVLSFSLETEIEGVVPWRRAQMSGVGGIRQATARPRPGALIRPPGTGSTKWAYFLLGLKAGLEGGSATPYPGDMAISTWG